MRNKYIVYLLVLGPFVCFSQGSLCDSLYHQYNPKNFSLRTTALIINQLKSCDENTILLSDFDNPNKNSRIVSIASNAGQNTAKGFLLYRHPDERLQLLKVARQEEKNEKAEKIKVAYEKGRFANKLVWGGVGVAANVVAAKFTGGFSSVLGTRLAVYAGTQAITYKTEALINQAEKNAYKINAARMGKFVAEEYNLNIELRCGGDLDCIANTVISPFESNPERSEYVTKKIFKEVVGSSEEFYQQVESQPSENRSEQEKIDFKANSIKGLDDIKKLDEAEVLATMTVAKKYLDEISAVQNDLLKFQNDVSVSHNLMNGKINGLINNNQIVIGELKKHQELIAQNTADNQIIQSILFDQLDVNKKLEMYKNCRDGKAGCLSTVRGMNSDQRDSTINRLERIQTVNNVVSKAQEYMGYLQAGADIAVSLGIKGKDAERLGKGMFYAQAATTSIIAGAKLFGGVWGPNSLADAASLISGISSILGGPGAAKPSPEMQAIQQLRQEMHERFDEVNVKLDTLLSVQFKLHKDLSENVRLNRELTQFGFNQIGYQLGDVLNNQKVIQSQLNFLINQDFNNCTNLLKNVVNNPSLNFKLESYEDYETLYQVNGSACELCLTALKNRLNSTTFSTTGTDINLITFGVKDSTDYVDGEINNYRKITTFFKWYYGTVKSNLLKSTEQLTLPSRTVDENMYTYYNFKDSTFNAPFDVNEVLNDTYYLDPYGFRDFLNIYSAFYPYFEFQVKTASYEPQNLDALVSFSNNDQQTARIRKSIVSTDINVLGKVSNVISMQQVLTSGHMLIRPFYIILYKGEHGEENVSFNGVSYSAKRLAIDILNSNPVFARNFASYVLRRNYGLSEKEFTDSTMTNEVQSPNMVAINNYAYAGNPTLNIVTASDSIFLEYDSTTTTSVNIVELKKFAKYDTLNFQDLGSGMAYLRIDAPNINNTCDTVVRCTARIPVPSLTVLQSNEMSYKEGYFFNEESSTILNTLKEEVEFPDNLNNNWLELSQLKSFYSKKSTP